MKKELAVLVLGSVALLFLLHINPPEAPKSQPAANATLVALVRLEELKKLYQPVAYLPVAEPVAAPVYTQAVQWKADAARAANVQVEGVDEDDYVKFDGEQFYVAHSGRLYTVGLDLSIRRVVECPTADCKVFVWGGRALVYGVVGDRTVLYVYDGGRRVAVYNFSGFPMGARMAGGVVYIVASAPLDVEVNGKRVEEALLLSLGEVPHVLVVAAVDLQNLRFNYTAAVSSPSSHVYMRGGRLYVVSPLGAVELAYEAAKKTWGQLPEDLRSALNMSSSYAFAQSLQKALRAGGERLVEYLNKANATTSTRVYVFDVSGVDIRLRAVFDVPGQVLDQFAVEEAGGRFVLATTVRPVRFTLPKPYFILPVGAVVDILVDGVLWGKITPPPAPEAALATQLGAPSSSVYVYDLDGRLVGRIEGLAPGEQIYAARLVGHVLYLVTFRQVDPLFAIDLSKPEEPRVLGYLKIPGFSEYLHPVGEGRLLGVGAYQGGMKIALFDVSDPTRPREVSNITVTNAASPIYFDHHAFSYEPGRRLAVVPFYSWGWPQAWKTLVVSVGDKLGIAALLDAQADRAFFKDDHLYLVGRGRLWAYDREFKKVGEAELR
ncbi:MAG: beta-propeller domain-containing protein [Pyrobaculum sp.]